MSRNLYLLRRDSGIYVVRLVVPQRLRRAVGRGEIHRSTGCRDLVMAKVVAAGLAAEWHRRIARLRHMDIKKLVDGSVELLSDGTLPLQHAADLLSMTPGELARQLGLRRAPFFVVADHWQGWSIDDVYELDRGFDDRGDLETIEIEPTVLARIGRWEKISRTLKIWQTDDAVAAAENTEGMGVCVFTFPPSPSAGFVVEIPGRLLKASDLLVQRADVEDFRSSLVERLDPRRVEALRQPTTPVVVHALDSLAWPKFAARPLSDLTADYLTKKRLTWKADEVRRQEDACSALVELSGNAKLSEVDRDLVWKVAVSLQKVPANRGKLRSQLALAEQNWTAFIELAERDRLPRLSAQSVQRLLEDINSVFEWGFRQQWLRSSPTKGLSAEVFSSMGGKKIAASVKRDAFTDDDLAAIFGTTPYPDGVGGRTKQGSFHFYRPFHYWLPLLGLFTGGRVNELSQLYLDDFKCDGDSKVWYLDFNVDQPDKLDIDEVDLDGVSDGSDKSLKSVAARRLVPLHERLIKLGLLDYVDALGSAGHTRLFPELPHDAVKGYGKYSGKWFNDVLLGKKLSIPRNGRKVFHSFRHNFSTTLERGGVPDKAVKQLMGHSLESLPGAGATAGYQKLRLVQELNPYIQSLVPTLPHISNFKVPEGLEAVRDALKLKRSHRRPGSRPQR